MLVDPALGLFVVADGMGGHNAGEVASAIAVRTLREFMGQATETTEAVLVRGIALANAQVLNAANTRSDYEGMGTTVVAALVRGERLLFGSVGDSRLYSWRAGALTQLTRDDSWVSRVLPANGMTAEDAQMHPMRHVLTKVVGLRDDMEPAVGESVFARGDLLVLCSDGLHGALRNEQIVETLRNGTDVQEIAQTLVSRALKAGAADNVTVIVVRNE